MVTKETWARPKLGKICNNMLKLNFKAMLKTFKVITSLNEHQWQNFKKSQDPRQNFWLM